MVAWLASAAPASWRALASSTSSSEVVCPPPFRLCSFALGFQPHPFAYSGLQTKWFGTWRPGHAFAKKGWPSCIDHWGLKNVFDILEFLINLNHRSPTLHGQKEWYTAHGKHLGPRWFICFLWYFESATCHSLSCSCTYLSQLAEFRASGLVFQSWLGSQQAWVLCAFYL